MYAVAAGVLVLAIVLILALISAWVTVPEGYAGVKTEKGAASGDVYEPGWSLQMPATEGYEEIETRPKTVTYNGDDAIYVLTEDGQDTWVDVTVRYTVDADDAPQFYEVAKSHQQAQNRFIEPDVRSDVRDEGSAMTARGIITKEGRQQLEAAAMEAVQNSVEGTGMTVESVAIRNVELNDKFSAELEQIEIENAQAEQRVIEAEGKAEAEITEANGTAEAYQIRGESLDENEIVLNEKYIESIDRGDQIVLGTNDEGTPVILDANGNGSGSNESDSGLPPAPSGGDS